MSLTATSYFHHSESNDAAFGSFQNRNLHVAFPAATAIAAAASEDAARTLADDTPAAAIATEAAMALEANV